MIVIDNNILVAYSSNDIPDDRKRVINLFKYIDAHNLYVGIPTPVIAEYLIIENETRTQILNSLISQKRIKVLSFDLKSAYECSLIEDTARKTGNKLHPLEQGYPYQKIKIDRQIIAIALSHNAQQLITNDLGLKKTAELYTSLNVKLLSDLPEERQKTLDI